MELTQDRIATLHGTEVYAADGEKIGSAEEFFVDTRTGQPEWISVSGGLFGMKHLLVPATNAEMREDAIHVPYGKDQVKDAPGADGDEISEERERDLYDHYGLNWSEARSESQLPEGEPGYAPRTRPGTADEAELVRTEEELQVGKREREAGRARLRKWVETEPAELDVDLRRETARVTREPVDRPASDAEIGEEEVEVPLRREEPVVQKETVAKERVGLERDAETERATVSEEVRKERFDVEGDVEKR